MTSLPAGPHRLEHEWWDRPLPSNIRLDPTSWLHSSFAFLHCASQQPVALTVGASSGLYAGTMLDLGPHGEVRIGRYCTIVAPVFATNGLVVIGDHVLVSSGVVMADDAAARPWGPDRPVASASPDDREPVIRIGSGAWIGTGCILLAGADIGEDAIVGASSVVDGPVPAGSVAAGNPYRIVRQPR